MHSKCTDLVINIFKRKTPKPYLKLCYRCVYNVFLITKKDIDTCYDQLIFFS